MIDPNTLADNLERDGRDKAFVVIDRAEMLVVLAALRLYGAAAQPIPDLERYYGARPAIFRADGRIEVIEPTASA